MRGEGGGRNRSVENRLAYGTERVLPNTEGVQTLPQTPGPPGNPGVPGKGSLTSTVPWQAAWDASCLPPLRGAPSLPSHRSCQHSPFLGGRCRHSHTSGTAPLLSLQGLWRGASAQHLLTQVDPPVCSKAALLGKALPTRQALEVSVSCKASLVWQLGGLSRAAAPPALVVLERPLPSVGSLMTEKATLAAEICPTLPAPEHSPVPVGLLLVLHPQWPLHQALSALTFCTRPAPGVHLLMAGDLLLLRDWRSAVPSLVGQKEPLLPEALSTGRAGEGPLPAVYSLVREQVLLEAEVLPADAAPEGLLPGVDPLVDDEVVLEAEAPSTLRAHKGPLSSMLLLLVPQEAQRLREALPTHRALVLLLLHLAVDDQNILIPRALLPGREGEVPVCRWGALVRKGSLLLVPLHRPIVS